MNARGLQRSSQSERIACSARRSELLMGRGTTKLAATLTAVCMAFLVNTAGAGASFHEMKIREISAGTGPANSSYVEIQMYAPFQQYLSLGAHLLTCSAACSGINAFNGPFADVASGANQSTVVFGDSGLPSASKDINVPSLSLDIIAAGGALCYLSEPGYNDCVSWGNFSANETLVASYGTSAGTPAPALVPGMALRRSISAGCASELQPSDDTDNSAADFAVTTPNPRPNSLAPTETPCGATPPGNPTSPVNPAGNIRKRKCKKKQKRSAQVAKKKKCKKKKKR